MSNKKHIITSAELQGKSECAIKEFMTLIEKLKTANQEADAAKTRNEERIASLQKENEAIKTLSDKNEKIVKNLEEIFVV